MPGDRESLQDIVASIHLIERYVAGIDFDEFTRDDQRQDAVVRRFEIIGEAAKRVSTEFRSRYPEIPWKQMAGMRDRVIHGYDTIDFAIVWDTIEQNLPELVQQLETVLQSGEDESEDMTPE